MHRFGDLVKGNGLVGKLVVGAQLGVVLIFIKAEKTEAFGQFHHRAGFGLGRGRAFAHLFVGADHSPCMMAAGAEKYGDI